jgi:hypothetical protein
MNIVDVLVSQNICYHSFQNLFTFSFLQYIIKVKISKRDSFPDVLYLGILILFGIRKDYQNLFSALF